MDEMNETKMSPEEKEELRASLACPDIRPQPFDVTFDAWLHRLKLWGKVNIEHYDPDLKVKARINIERFLDKISDDNLNRMFGRWHTERLDFNKVQFYREFLGLNGKQVRETFTIWIELKPELKKASGDWWKFWRWNKQ